MRPARLPDQAADLRRLLNDPRRLCEKLGLLDGAKPQSGGLFIKCPWHAEKNPSCSVTCPDGTIRVKCFGCGVTGDVYHLIARVHGIDLRRDFRRVLAAAAELGGISLDDDVPPPPSRPAPQQLPTRDYPPRAEVIAFLESTRPVTDDAEVANWFRLRGLDAAAVEALDLARALPVDATQSRWARTRQWGPWVESGHRCLVSMYDEIGQLRSVRARRVVARDDDAPKALPPAGHRVSGLVMACPLARQILQRGGRPHFWPARSELVIVVAEGEPDFLKWASAYADGDLTAPAVFGIVAGSWTPAIAARIPDGADVCIWTHNDPAGDKYADQIIRTLDGRVTLRRGQP